MVCHTDYISYWKLDFCCKYKKIFQYLHNYIKSAQKSTQSLCVYKCCTGLVYGVVELLYSQVSNPALLLYCLSTYQLHAREIFFNFKAVFSFLRAVWVSIEAKCTGPATMLVTQCLHRQHGEFILLHPMFLTPAWYCLKFVKVTNSTCK